ncbi:Arm DNA-binding domain-containing protein [Mucilaginibacter gossypii]|uniref:Arm DNA-binding domain-containing protein n=1 Tax=Mucilaginibacter gossypii TaxID=551996 RepID=UPI001676AB8A
MKTSFILLLCLKKPKNYNDDPVPIYLRVTVNGKRVETTASRTSELSQWNSKAGRLKGIKESVRVFNAYLDTLQANGLCSSRKPDSPESSDHCRTLKKCVKR